MTEETPPAAKRGCLRSALLNLGLVAITLLLTLGAAELAVRLVMPQQIIQVRPDIWMPADSVGWLNRPGVRTTINTGERTVHLYTDSLGMRVGAAGRRDAPTRVLVIGDSFMEALQVEYEQGFAALLERWLSDSLSRPVAVYDAGVDGWDPPQYLIRTRQLLDRMPADAVVVSLYLGNDVVRQRQDNIPPRIPTVHHPFRIPRHATWHEFVDALLYPVNDALKDHSHLYILVRARLHTVLMRLKLTGEYFPEELLRSEAASPRWGITADLCREIADAAARHGVPTVIMMIPTPFAVDPATFDQARRGFGLRADQVDLDQPTRLMAAALAARHLQPIDVLPAFRAEAARGTQLYGNVDRHLTPAGHLLLTSLVAPAVRLALAGRRPAATPLKH